MVFLYITISVTGKKMHFDLISDLHIDFWEKPLVWEGLGTSLIAVVAGDISRDWNTVYDYLLMLSEHYKHVIYIDGNHEHNMLLNFRENANLLYDRLRPINNITYLHRSSIILDGTAFIGCNGWWTYDFAQPEYTTKQAYEKLLSMGLQQEFLEEILFTAKEDSQTLVNCMKIFDNDPNIENVVVVTHTAPFIRFRWAPSDVDFANMARTGSSLLPKCLEHNSNRKIRTWCFGHVHTEIDVEIDGIRYVCHPRGLPNHSPPVYYPKLISF